MSDQQHMPPLAGPSGGPGQQTFPQHPAGDAEAQPQPHPQSAPTSDPYAVTHTRDGEPIPSTEELEAQLAAFHAKYDALDAELDEEPYVYDAEAYEFKFLIDDEDDEDDPERAVLRLYSTENDVLDVPVHDEFFHYVHQYYVALATWRAGGPFEFRGNTIPPRR